MANAVEEGLVASGTGTALASGRRSGLLGKLMRWQTLWTIGITICIWVWTLAGGLMLLSLQFFVTAIRLLRRN